MSVAAGKVGVRLGLVGVVGAVAEEAGEAAVVDIEMIERGHQEALPPQFPYCQYYNMQELCTLHIQTLTDQFIPTY